MDRDIKIEAMAKRLKLDCKTLERYLQNMNALGKVTLSIDHKNELVTFKKPEEMAEQNRRALGKFCGLLEHITMSALN